MREQYNLATIVATDVVVRSRLMGRDERETVARLIGDGARIEFGTVIQVPSVAIEFQQSMAERETARQESKQLAFRVGLYFRDAEVESDDPCGDAEGVEQHTEAAALVGSVLDQQSGFHIVLGVHAALLDLVGRIVVATRACKSLTSIVPTRRLSNLGNWAARRDEQAVALIAKGLRLAGLAG